MATDGILFIFCTKVAPITCPHIPVSVTDRGLLGLSRGLRPSLVTRLYVHLLCAGTAHHGHHTRAQRTAIPKQVLFTSRGWKEGPFFWGKLIGGHTMPLRKEETLLFALQQ